MAHGGLGRAVARDRQPALGAAHGAAQRPPVAALGRAHQHGRRPQARSQSERGLARPLHRRHACGGLALRRAHRVPGHAGPSATADRRGRRVGHLHHGLAAGIARAVRDPVRSGAGDPVGPPAPARRGHARAGGARGGRLLPRSSAGRPRPGLRLRDHPPEHPERERGAVPQDLRRPGARRPHRGARPRAQPRPDEAQSRRALRGEHAARPGWQLVYPG